MARRSGRAGRDIEAYAHAGKERANNPPVGLVTPDTDRDAKGKAYDHDPHMDPQLSWAGKAAHTSFGVPNVSLQTFVGFRLKESETRYSANAKATRRMEELQIGS